MRNLVFLCFLFSFFAQAQEQNLNELNLEDLLNVKISVASKEGGTLVSSPGIVSLVTAEEIRNAGARDLIDVLQLVPGFTFGLDTEGVIGLSIRGNWAHEGKVLLLIDGEEMNEMFYGTLQFGHEFPVDSISRVEVIRGPGSAVYGGHAELAVINVITKTGAEMNGLQATGVYAHMDRATSMQDIGLGAGKSLSSGWNFSSYLWSARGDRADRDYTDSAGDTFNMKGNSSQKPSYVNLGASDNKWSFRFIYDDVRGENRTAYGANTPATVNLDFRSILFGATYRTQIGEHLTLKPELHLRQQEPWKSTDELSNSVTGLRYERKGDEIAGRVTASWKFNEAITGHLGGEVVRQTAEDLTEGSTFANGTQELKINRQAAFTEINWNNPVANLTVGGRFQNQEDIGSKFVPRFAAVRQMGAWHAKLLYSMGYRSPDFENLDANPDIRPETTSAAEAEVGYKLNANTLMTLNVFHMTTEDPIIYDYSGGQDAYFNFSSTGTHGAELDVRHAAGWGYISANYSRFMTHSSHVAEYQHPTDADRLLGMPTDKATVNGNLKLGVTGMRVNLTATYLSERYGYDWDGTAMNIKRFDAVLLTDLYLEKRDLLVRGLDLGAGLHNLLNEDYRYIEPYNGGHPPMPAQSREWMAKVSYRYGF